MSTGMIRGRAVTWDAESEVFRWTDNGQPATGWGGVERPCPACGLTAEGDEDPCLGILPDCESACCGHGGEGWISRKSHDLTLIVSGVRHTECEHCMDDCRAALDANPEGES